MLEQKLSSKQKDETQLPSSPNNGNTHVSGSANHGFLLDAINELETYRTPKKIVDYIEAERLKVIIGNPPFDV